MSQGAVWSEPDSLGLDHNWAAEWGSLAWEEMDLLVLWCSEIATLTAYGFEINIYFPWIDEKPKENQREQS